MIQQSFLSSTVYRRFLSPILLCTLLLGLTSVNVSAQEETETLTLKEALRKATILFDEGYPKKVPSILNPALKSAASESDKIRAYELLTNAYLFMKEEQKADTAYLKLLRLNPIYQPNEDVSSRDLIYFSEGFITYPKFSIGLKAGNSINSVNTLKKFSVDDTENTNEEYQRMGGYQFSLHLQYALTKNILSLVAEPTIGKKNYRYSARLHSQIPNDISGIVEHAIVELEETQTWLDIPLLLRTSLGSPEFKLYVEGGIAYNFLLEANFEPIRTGNEQEEINLLASNVNMRQKSNISMIGGVGIDYRVKLNYITIGFRYQKMLNNLVNPANRFSNPDLLYKFGLVEDDFSMNTLMLNIGYVKAFYASKKKKNFQFIKP